MENEVIYQCGNCGEDVYASENVNNGYCSECTDKYDK